MTESLRAPLAKVRGLGSAKGGTQHFWLQRLTAIALIPLTVWFALSIASLASADQGAVQSWMQSPLSATLMISFLVAGFWHMKLGIQVVIEDYAHKENRFVMMILLNVFTAAAAAIAIVSILKVAFGAAA